MLYKELEIIRELKNKTTKIEMILLFIEEYSGWLQHLKSVGLSWGSHGEEMGANKEAVKTRKHIDDLKEELLNTIS